MSDISPWLWLLTASTVAVGVTLGLIIREMLGK